MTLGWQEADLFYQLSLSSQLVEIPKKVAFGADDPSSWDADKLLLAQRRATPASPP